MKNNIKVNIQYFLSRGMSKDLLLKAAKEGIYLEEQTLVDMEVYSIFKPILSACHISRTEYMSKEDFRQSYMKAFTTLYKKYQKGQKEKNEEISLDDFGKQLNSISASWSKVYTNASHNKREKVPGIKLDEISFIDFCQLNEETRNNLSEIASKKIYSYDYAIYQAFKKELKNINEIDFIDFIQNDSLKEKYRKKTENVRKGLAEQEGKEVSISSAINKIAATSNEWFEYVESGEGILPDFTRKFSESCPLETFCLMSKTKKKELEEKITRETVSKIKKSFDNQFNDNTSKTEITEMLNDNSKKEMVSTSQK